MVGTRAVRHACAMKVWATAGRARKASWLSAAWLIALCLACSDDAHAPSPLLPTADGGDAATQDANVDATAPYVRPDGGPRLPGVDAQVTLPFLGPAQVVVVEIDAALRALDVHFSVDTTASFRDEISVLQDDLSDVVVPELRRRIDDVSVGVSSFEDFPHTPFGTEGDDPYELQTAITSDLQRVNSALAGLDRPLGNGGDGPESGAEALYQVATGEGYRQGTRWLIDRFDNRALAGGGRIGGVGFRQGALHALVHITDAPTHNPSDYESVFPGTHSMQQAAAALKAIDVRMLGVVTGAQTDGDAKLQSTAELEQVASTTGAVMEVGDDGCPTGIDGASRPPVNGQCPLVFLARDDGDGLSDALTDAIVALVNAVDLKRVSTEISDDRLGFVLAVEATGSSTPNGGVEPERVDEQPADGIDDTFLNVRPGTKLRFAVHLRNALLVADDAPQFYTITINLLGDGLSLGTRAIRIEIPARTPSPPFDAGADAAVEDDASGM